MTIGLITVSNDTFTNPTLCALIEQLGTQGNDVALFNDKNLANVPNHLKHIQYFDAPKGILFPKRPDNFVNYLQLYRRMIKQLKSNAIVHLIAVDPIGLVLAGRIKKLYKKINIHYFSFEIFFNEEVKNNPIYSNFKKKEIFYSRYVSSIVIQDKLRRKNLINENKIDVGFDKWYFIPVAPILTESLNQQHRSTYALKEDDIIYIHSGSIAEWSGIEHVISAVERGLPERTVIFVHNRTKFESSNPVHQKLLQLSIANPNLILHDEVFDDYNEYLSFLAMFDYGIVLYEPDGGIFTGNNIRDIGLSSGKFSSYMAAGLPSLMYDCQMYREIAENFKIGTIVSSRENLSFHIKNRSLMGIKKDACRDYYQKSLNPISVIQEFIRKELYKTI